MDEILLNWGFKKHNELFEGFKYIRKTNKSWNHDYFYQIGENTADLPGIHINTLEYVEQKFNHPDGKIVTVYFSSDDIYRLRDIDKTVIVSRMFIKDL